MHGAQGQLREFVDRSVVVTVAFPLNVVAMQHHPPEGHPQFRGEGGDRVAVGSREEHFCTRVLVWALTGVDRTWDR
jgi:hypothetical protein